MLHYKIADVTVAMESFGRTVTQAEPYRIEKCDTPDITITGRGALLHQQYPELSEEDCAYLATGASFYWNLLNYDGMMLHASAVVMDGKAYLFCAPCGTGKSTHTSLWQQVFGPDRAKILNDDKPAVRFMDGKFYAYGTPWSGKHDISINARFPLAGICILSQGPENKIERCAPGDGIFALMDQTFRPRSPEKMDQLLTMIDRVLTAVPLWRMTCNMDPQAAIISYEAMSAV